MCLSFVKKDLNTLLNDIMCVGFRLFYWCITFDVLRRWKREKERNRNKKREMRNIEKYRHRKRKKDKDREREREREREKQWHRKIEDQKEKTKEIM